ncbi:TraB/GumN family protein [Aurantimonas sp. VKM B-3413]|uniref:TraB/GumN family protein n=1 Tax=Aurantimonas sp. VKM B-3413 TaxID=2779401 RepID=UPI001E2CB788|nr:TraB/GumN family protein [Aurantimonas sp. VKM B-3413]MCB8840609.1 TraB/GumN family protein [Aurantimonas sp. VKM B-3413]
MTDWPDKIAALLWRMALALPGLVLLALLVGIAVAKAETKGPADDSSCHGTSLVASLQAEGKLAGVEAEAKAVPNGEGRLFRIERPGLATSYLFGTMHLTDPRILALPTSVETAFDKADRLVIETVDVMDEKKAMAALFAHPEILNLPAGKTLADYLDPAERAAVETGLAEHGIPFQAVQTLQPWFTAMGLMLPACETSRKKEGMPVLDTELGKMAQAEGKPVEGLESAEEQLRAIASIPLDIQAESLVAMVSVADRMPDILETMTSLYLEGRIGMILPAIQAAVPEGGLIVGAGEGYGAFEEKVVTARNYRMAERLAPFLKQGGTFAAVGALHLPGEKGLVALLREAGWTVTRAD